MATIESETERADQKNIYFSGVHNAHTFEWMEKNISVSHLHWT